MNRYVDTSLVYHTADTSPLTSVLSRGERKRTNDDAVPPLPAGEVRVRGVASTLVEGCLSRGVHPTHSRGMTLIELLVAIAIIMILLPAIYASIESLYDQHASTFARSVALTKANETLRGIILDIRGSVYSESGALPLIAIATSSLAFYTDTDFDGKVEQVRYTLTDATLTKGVIDPTATSSYPASNEVVYTLSTHITNNENGTPLFRYWSATSTEITATTSILDVRRVSVLLEQEHRMRGVDGAVSLESSASIRNLKNTY